MKDFIPGQLVRIKFSTYGIDDRIGIFIEIAQDSAWMQLTALCLVDLGHGLDLYYLDVMFIEPLQ